MKTSAFAAALCVVSYFFLPAAGAPVADPKIPRNVNYVFGFSEETPQRWLPPLAYLGAWIATLVGAIYVPTHWLLRKTCPLTEHSH